MTRKQINLFNKLITWFEMFYALGLMLVFITVVTLDYIILFDLNMYRILPSIIFLAIATVGFVACFLVALRLNK